MKLLKRSFAHLFPHLLVMHNKVQTSELVKNSFSCIMMLTMNTISFDLGERAWPVWQSGLRAEIMALGLF